MMMDSKRFRDVEKIYENIGVMVYKAFDLQTNTDIAYKVISSNVYEELLRKEFKLLKYIDGERVVKALEFIDSDEVAMITPFCEGSVLKYLITENSLKYKEKVKIALEIAKAIREVHEKKIIHKDINPTNLIWNSASQSIKLIDFNIAERVTSQKVDFVNPKHMQGTLAYISPEQTGRLNRDIDYRTDYYSFGVTLYELFTGHLPYGQEDYLKVIHQHLATEPKPPIEVNTFVPQFMSDIILKLMNKDVAERYQSLEGILYDLTLCINSEGQVNEAVGLFDALSTLQHSQKIYGREAELKRLVDGFDRVIAGSFEHCFISGFSGVGKTALIRELYPSVTYASGYFLAGKYDQYNLNMPYSGILQALQDFVSLLLTEDEKNLVLWKEKILLTLGESAGVMTQFLPELELILGKQTSVEVTGIEAQNRFGRVMQNFLTVIASEEHPVVMFLDDLQWIDGASLNLIKLSFENKDIKHLYFVGAFRSNEVHKAHALSIFLDNLDMSETINYIELSPLKSEDVDRWLLDTFPGMTEHHDITNRIMEKTNGNAFFTKQIFNLFYDLRCVYYADELGRWLVDEACVKAINISDNVAYFLGEQMRTFDKKILDVLKSAASIGNTFTLKTLQSVLNQSSDEVMEMLNQLIDEGYILMRTHDHYAFSHDQIQQAAYTVIEEEEYPVLHLKIFKALLNQYPVSCEDEVIFELAGHLKKSLVDGHTQVDLSKACRILKQAGDYALKSIAYDNAHDYYQIAYRLLEHESFDQLQLSLLNALITTAYMLGHFDDLEHYLTILKQHVDDPFDLTHAYEIELQSYMARSLHQKGLELILHALMEFGFEVKLDVGDEDYAKAFGKLATALNEKKIEDLIDLEVMTDTRVMNLMKMITSFLPLIYNAAPQILVILVINMVVLSIENGNSTYSPYAYSFLGTLLNGVLGDFENAYKYGVLSVELIDKLDVKTEIAKTYMLTSQHIYHLKSHLSHIIEMEEKAYNSGIETGDLTHAGFAAHGYCFNYYLAGRELKKTQKKFETYTAAMIEINQSTQTAFQNIYLQTIENIRTKDNEQWILSGEWFDEHTDLDSFIEQGNRTAMFVYYFNKMQLAYLFNRYEEANTYVLGLEEFLDGGLGLMHVPIFYQYRSLILLALYDDMDPSAKAFALEIIQKNQSYLSPLKDEINYKHRYLIVEAELARVKKDNEQARAYYEEAIGLVAQYMYVQDEALYRELSSKFYSKQGSEEIAHYYMSTAHSCYVNWGAKSKANETLDKQEGPFDVSHKNSIYTMHSLKTAVGISQNIDLRSILEFSQTIASEIKYEELMKKMLHIILENAGGDKVTIINFSKNKNMIMSEVSIEGNYRSGEFEDIHEITELPSKVINYVYHSKKIVRLDIATQNNMFSDDLYISKHKIKSLLCFPLVLQGKIIGLIYLENRLSKSIFSKERIEFISLMSSQIAISLENAMVYKNLEVLVEERTTDLELKNKELVDLNMQLRTISITDGLTGLFNRRKLDDVLEYEVSKTLRYKSNLSIILMDIDYFKNVNDTYGHNVGDQVLIKIANILTSNTRKSDIVGRWGGEEFLVVCPEIEFSSAVKLAKKLNHAIEDYDFGEVGTKTGSFGVTKFIEGEQIKDVLKRVDDYLYIAKRTGRNKVVSKAD